MQKKSYFLWGEKGWVMVKVAALCTKKGCSLGPSILEELRIWA